MFLLCLLVLCSFNIRFMFVCFDFYSVLCFFIAFCVLLLLLYTVSVSVYEFTGHCHRMQI